MPTIKIEVSGKIAKNLTPEVEIVSSNGDYEIEFLFDSEWESSNVKTARFFYNFKTTDVVFEGNVCKIPSLQETNLLKVGVFTDNQKTTTDAEIKCKYSIKKYGGNVHKPQEDVYSQIIELLNKYLEQGGEIDLSAFQTRLDEGLATNSKEVVGAINEVNEKASQGGSQLDVQIDGQSIVEDGVANIPFDYNTMKSLTTPTNYTWTEDEKAEARKTIGACDEWNGDRGGYYTLRYRAMDGRGVNKTGTIVGYNSPKDYALAIYADGGILSTNAPKSDLNCINLKYFNDNKGTKVYKHSWYGSGGKWGDVPELVFSYISFDSTPEEGLTPSNCEGRGITIINERKGFLAKNTLRHDIIGTSHTQDGLCFAILQYGVLNFASGFGSMPMSMFDTIIDEVIEL